MGKYISYHITLARLLVIFQNAHKSSTGFLPPNTNLPIHILQLILRLVLVPLKKTMFSMMMVCKVMQDT